MATDIKGECDICVFTGPSGAGKTTIVDHLVDKYVNKLSFSVSATTRERRENEIDGEDYYFMSEEEFKVLIEEDAFLEWEEVYPGKYYGTLKSEIEKNLAENNKMILVLDVYGAQNIKQRYGDRCFSVFVKAPSFNALIKRLENRDTESPDSFQKRVKQLKKEMLFEHSFDQVLLNDKKKEALDQAEKLIEKYLI